MNKEEYWNFGISFIFHYIYKEPLLPIEQLTPIQIKAIQEYQPRTLAEQHPDLFPDENGDDGETFELYRGIFCKDEIEFTQLLEAINQGQLKLSTLTSWSNHPMVAEKFANGAGYYAYTNDKEMKGYKGVVIKSKQVEKSSTLFSAMEAEGDLELEYEDFFSNRKHEEQYHAGEEEIVLLPGTYPVTIHQIFDIKE